MRLALAILGLCLPLAAQLTTPSTTLAQAVNPGIDTPWCVASSAGIVLPSIMGQGSILFIDKEAAQVTRSAVTPNCYNVKRGQLGTSGSVSHSVGRTVWIGTAATGTGDNEHPFTGTFATFAPSGSCTAGLQYSLPVIVIGIPSQAATELLWYCSQGQWSNTVNLNLLGSLTTVGTITAGGSVTSGPSGNGGIRLPSVGGNTVAIVGTATQQGATYNPSNWGNAGTFTLPTVLSAQHNSADTLTAATINTTETAFATAFTFQAGFFADKTVAQISMLFEETTSGTPVTQRIRIRLGGLTGTVLYDTAVGVTPGVNLATRGIPVVVTLMGTAAAGAAVPIETAVGGEPPTPTTPFSVANTIAQGVNVATNASQQFVVTMTYSGNTAGNSVTLRQMIVTQLQN